MSVLRYFLPNGGDIWLNFTHIMDFFAEWKAADSENNFLYHLFRFLYYNNQFKMHNNFKQTKIKSTGQSPLKKSVSGARLFELHQSSLLLRLGCLNFTNPLFSYYRVKCALMLCATKERWPVSSFGIFMGLHVAFPQGGQWSEFVPRSVLHAGQHTVKEWFLQRCCCLWTGIVF